MGHRHREAKDLERLREEECLGGLRGIEGLRNGEMRPERGTLDAVTSGGRSQGRGMKEWPCVWALGSRRHWRINEREAPVLLALLQEG